MSDKDDNKAEPVYIYCRRCKTQLGREDATLFGKFKCPDCGLVATWRPSVPKEERRTAEALCAV